MITCTEKKSCCGCGVCAAQCPEKSIEMREDREGFLYPEINEDQCLSCGLCKKVCPHLRPLTQMNPEHAAAVQNLDSPTRLMSSSGGVFSLLAEQTISLGGVVFGARFNEQWEVVHDYATTLEGCVVFRGSKYVQSRIDNSYNLVRQFLAEGRQVLFSGTPCQVAGLKGLVGDHQNLLCVDFICHGVPSPKVFRKYLMEATENGGTDSVSSFSDSTSNRDGMAVGKVEFRDKSHGWRNFHFVISADAQNQSDGNRLIVSESVRDNPYLRGFINDLFLRPSCYACPVRHFSSGSDVTLGDFWGVEKVVAGDDDTGVSLVIVHNREKVSLDPRCVIGTATVEKIINFNKSMFFSPKVPRERTFFFDQLDETKLVPLINHCVHTIEKRNRIVRKKQKVKKLLSKLLTRFWG